MRQQKIGRWPALSAPRAIAEWETLRDAREAGADPSLAKRELRQAQAAKAVAKRASTLTVQRLVDDYLARRPRPGDPANTGERQLEVFAGGAALYFLRPPADVEVINDVNGELVNLYRVVQSHLEEFVRQFKWALSSKEVFKWLQDTPPATLTDIQRLAMQGKAIVSIDDHPEVRACFEGLHMETLDITYQVGGGHRPAARKELLIFSWDVEAEPAGLF